ncbi:Solute carrier family 35 member G1 [Orchesella cincta]|uniref:Solute carrier family 35 member G1 n=1 Tax=Orchesella cincta TaxID=48709 RepID=A0A1D2MYM6_ORCCI|nr:Solute carrier family 35 member G1 [Orchesella cincta]
MLALGVCETVEGLVVSLFISPFEYPSWNVEDWGLACIIGVLFFCGQLTMTLALQIEEAGVVSLVRTCDVLFSFVFQVMFLQQEANIFSYLGALIVTTGVALTALRKWLMELPEHSLMRQRLFFILR